MCAFLLRASTALTGSSLISVRLKTQNAPKGNDLRTPVRGRHMCVRA